MTKKKWIVIVDWVDGVVSDSDEVVVFAGSESAAISGARKKWKDTVADQWPNCLIESAWVLTREREAQLGLL